MNNDVKILRGLAYQYAEAMHSERNARIKQLYIASNDLHMIRPVVCIDEIPWGQINVDGSMDCLCEDDGLRGVEWGMREALFRRKYLPVDTYINEYIGVQRAVHVTGCGLEVEEHTIASETDTSIVSHEFTDLLALEDALEQLQMPVVTYDHEKTMAKFNKIGEAIGDILPVRLCGTNVYYNSEWDTIARYRGVMPLLMDLYDRPEHSHAVAQKFFALVASEFAQKEALGLLDSDAPRLHCTPGFTEDLPAPTDGKVTRKNLWGRGTAQAFGSVSPDMHDAFDIQYQIATTGSCGLVYYGCCEPLHNKIDIVEKIPNLRKIGVTPWADVDVATEIIGGRYVVSNKPNPAAVAVAHLDEDELRRELGKTLAACKRNGVRGLDITLKDISTVHHNPQNLFRWAQIAMELAEGY
ncbi:MAG: hypothetical protein LBS96_06290 [Oscillospiraceae bacterium]|jgi:hypothetical protein|nr:hypothetical protein [Oscillospiraceae bacterium]